MLGRRVDIGEHVCLSMSARYAAATCIAAISTRMSLSIPAFAHGKSRSPILWLRESDIRTIGHSDFAIEGNFLSSYARSTITVII